MTIVDAETLTEFRQDFQRAILQLLESGRLDARALVALLLHTEDRTYQEIGEVLAVSTATACRMVARASETIADSGLLDGYE